MKRHLNINGLSVSIPAGWHPAALFSFNPWFTYPWNADHLWTNGEIMELFSMPPSPRIDATTHPDVEKQWKAICELGIGPRLPMEAEWTGEKPPLFLTEDGPLVVDEWYVLYALMAGYDLHISERGIDALLNGNPISQKIVLMVSNGVLRGCILPWHWTDDTEGDDENS